MIGHALGIEGHSTNANDLMSIYYGHGVVRLGSSALRYLYHTPRLDTLAMNLKRQNSQKRSPV